MKTKIAAVAFAVLFACFAFVPSESQAGQVSLCRITVPYDGGTAKTTDQSDAGCTLLADGGISSCSVVPTCDMTGVRVATVQCDYDVFYTISQSGSFSTTTPKLSVPNAATANDVLISFANNKDSYRVDLINTGDGIGLRHGQSDAGTNSCRVSRTYRRPLP